MNGRFSLCLHRVDAVLRLYPSVPVNSRTALKTTTLPFGGGPRGTSPVLVRKGEGIGYNVYTMHRRKDIFGADADAFRPSRWNELSLKEIGWGYLPFNGGPRVCPGRKSPSSDMELHWIQLTVTEDFALLEASYVVIRLLQCFSHIKPADNSQSNEKQIVTLVLANAHGCKVVLTPS